MNFKYYNTQRLILTILILSVIITPISNYIEKHITSFKDLNIIYSYIGFFSTISIISLILLLTNNLFWKYPLFRWLVDLPNLNGRYEGVLTSSFIDPITQSQVKKKCVIEIHQNSSNIKVYSYYGNFSTSTETSESSSVSEQIIKKDNGIFELFYIFANDANTLESQLSNHLGTCHLKYFPDRKKLIGEYYNQRGLKGTIDVTFSQPAHLGRLNY